MSLTSKRVSEVPLTLITALARSLKERVMMKKLLKYIHEEKSKSSKNNYGIYPPLSLTMFFDWSEKSDKKEQKFLIFNQLIIQRIDLFYSPRAPYFSCNRKGKLFRKDINDDKHHTFFPHPRDTFESYCANFEIFIEIEREFNEKRIEEAFEKVFQFLEITNPSETMKEILMEKIDWKMYEPFFLTRELFSHAYSLWYYTIKVCNGGCGRQEEYDTSYASIIREDPFMRMQENIVKSSYANPKKLEKIEKFKVLLIENYKKRQTNIFRTELKNVTDIELFDYAYENSKKRFLGLSNLLFKISLLKTLSLPEEILKQELDSLNEEFDYGLRYNLSYLKVSDDSFETLKEHARNVIVPKEPRFINSFIAKFDKS